MPELADLDATDLLAVYKAREATPEEAVESCLRRVADTDAQVRAIVTLLADEALQRARHSARRWNAGRARRLDGIPYGLKDLIASALAETRAGTPRASPLAGSGDATLVKRLDRAGGILVAKLATYEFGAVPNDRTRNPWALDHTTSGSSSGPAAAVASRQLPVAIGTDTGGSILTPASVCGVTGLKPTFGRVPRRGIVPLSWTLDHAGLLTRSARDAAIVLEVVAGLDEAWFGQESARKDGLSTASGELGGLRLGVPTDWFFAEVDAQVAQLVHAAIRQLVALGMKIQAVEFPCLRSLDPNYLMSTIVGVEMAAVHKEQERGAHTEAFEKLLRKGRGTTAADYLSALAARRQVRLDFARALEHVDVIAAPGCVTIAPEAETGAVRMGSQIVPPNGLLSRVAAPLNLAGLPVITVPVGIDSQGLPVGMALFARRGADAVPLRVAYHYQQSTQHHLRMPAGLAASQVRLERSDSSTVRRTAFPEEKR